MTISIPTVQRRTMLSCLLPDPNLIVFDAVEIDDADGLITCLASVTQRVAFCPICMQPTSRIHSGYQRTLADLPWAGMPVQFRLHVRRFFCQNDDCARKIFTERVPTVAVPWARRTQRMTKAQQAIGLAAGGSGGTRRFCCKKFRPQVTCISSTKSRRKPRRQHD
jgi:transposase